MSAEQPLKVRAVVFEDGGVWVAQGVDYDIAAFAPTLGALPKAFTRAVGANLCANADLGREGLDGIPPAPKRFAALFKGADYTLSPRGGMAGPVKADLRVAQAA